MREVRHENLLPFIGACVDSGSVCVITAYCARGSLYDVLNDHDLQLDHMFEASLIADLIKVSCNHFHLEQKDSMSLGS